MKTNNRKLIQLSLSYFLFATGVGFILSSDIAAQRPKAPAATRSRTSVPKVEPPKKEYVNWYVSYTVTIKGRGEHKGDSQGQADIKWSVDRSFVGRMRLDGPTPRREGGKLVRGWETYENYGSQANPWTVNVKINDRLEKFWEGPGEIGTHENRTDVTTWEGSPTVPGGAEDLSALAVNNAARTYFVVLPMVPPSKEKSIRMSRFTIFDRSPVGYGCRPTREVTRPLDDKIAISDIPMPSGDYLHPGRRGSSWLTSTNSNEGAEALPTTYPYTIEFRRTCFPPDSPFFEGIGATKTQVEICVEILLSKMPH